LWCEVSVNVCKLLSVSELSISAESVKRVDSKVGSKYYAKE